MLTLKPTVHALFYVDTIGSCAQTTFVFVMRLCCCIYVHVVTAALLCHRNLCAASATVSPPAPAAAAAPAHQQEAPVLPFRVGYGFDLHRLVEGKKLIICGVDVPHVRGCDAHSDGMRDSGLPIIGHALLCKTFVHMQGSAPQLLQECMLQCMSTYDAMLEMQRNA